MEATIFDRIWETTTTTGTSTVTLGGARTGYRTFGSAVTDGTLVPYLITDGTDFEIGEGTYSSSTLTRATIFTSSNSNNAVNWGAGTKDVIMSMPAKYLTQINVEDSLISAEPISGGRVVNVNSSGAVQIAMASIATRVPAIGIVVENVASGLSTRIYNRGKVNSSQFDFSGYIGKPIWVGNSGELIVSGGPVTSGAINQPIGTVTSHSGILLGPVALISGQITNNSLSSGLIESRHLSASAVRSTNIASGAVVSGSIASGQIGTNHLILGIIVSGSISSGQIGTSHIASGGVLSGNIASGQIGTNHIASGGVLSGNIASGQIGANHIASGGVLSGNIASGQIGTNHLRLGTIVSGSIASGQIGTSHIASGGVLSGNIASGQIGTYKLASGAIINKAQFTTPIASGTSWSLITSEIISGTKAVSISTSGTLQVAMASVSTRMPAIGVVVENVASGIPANVYSEGMFQLTSGIADYSGYLGKSVYVGRSGNIVSTSGSFNSGGHLSGDIYQRIGTIFNSGGIIVQLSEAFKLASG